MGADMVELTRRAFRALVVLFCVATGPARSQSPRVIDVTAERFQFTPSEIVVDAGEEVELRLKSEDTSHGFRIKGTNVHLVAPKRGQGVVSAALKVTEPGRYPFECTRMCGAGHNSMRGVLVVRSASAK